MQLKDILLQVQPFIENLYNYSNDFSELLTLCLHAITIVEKQKKTECSISFVRGKTEGIVRGVLMF